MLSAPWEICSVTENAVDFVLLQPSNLFVYLLFCKVYEVLEDLDALPAIDVVSASIMSASTGMPLALCSRQRLHNYRVDLGVAVQGSGANALREDVFGSRGDDVYGCFSARVAQVSGEG